MLNRFLIISILLAMLLGISVWAMPPSPELLTRIHNGEVPVPYYMQHESELRARGIEAPHRALRDSPTDETYFPALILLVDFSDHVATTDPATYDSLIFGHANHTVNHFYNKSSYDDFHIVTDNYPSVVGWIRAPHPYSYYVDGQHGFGNYPQNAQGLTEDVINLADSRVDFSHYAHNGYVEGLFIVHAGTGAEMSGSMNDIWSHAWSIWPAAYLDGVNVQAYSMEPEFWHSSGDMNCGVFCHEMGHSVFGLPDLYDTDYSSEGLGRWSLMAGGSWNGGGANPAMFDAACKVWTNFVTPINVTGTLVQQAIPQVETSGVVYRMNVSTDSSEYYLVENRQQVSYDGDLPSSGLLIFHVDEHVYTSNTEEWYPAHTDSGHYRVALEQADGDFGLEHSSTGDYGDPYPGSSLNTRFTYGTMPNSRSYLGALTHIEVTDISASDSVMYATLSMEGIIHPPSIHLIAPNGGENFVAGSLQTIRWTSENLDTVVLYYRNNPNSPWVTTFNFMHPFGQVDWRAQGPASNQAMFRLCSYDSAYVDDSDTIFTISDIHITTPSANAVWEIGSTQTIEWTTAGVQSYEYGEINRNYPNGNWETIFPQQPNNGSASWVVTGPATDSARIFVHTRSMWSSDISQNIRIINGSGVNSRNAIPTKTSLAECYPNPFNNAVTIHYALHDAAPVNIKVYAVNGALVAELANGMQAQGMHQLTWKPERLASGEYIVEMRTAKFTDRKKVMYLK